MSLVGRVFSNRYEIQREIGPRRDGRGVSGPRSAARSGRRAEGPVPRVRARTLVRRTVPPRSTGRGEPQQRQHRRHLRLGPGSRHVLHRDGVRRRSLPARSHPQREPARSEPGVRDRGRDRLRARVRAPRRCRAPRREAGQRPAHARGQRQGHRLRHRARGHERRTHADRFGDGHRHLLLARASPRPRGRRSLGRVLARCRALRDGHRGGAVHRRLTGRGRVQARARRTDATVATQPRRSRRPRADHPHRARQGS